MTRRQFSRAVREARRSRGCALSFLKANELVVIDAVNDSGVVKVTGFTMRH